MKRAVNNIPPIVRLAFLLAAVVVMAILIGLGCTERLKGEFNANQKPYVNFINVPPDLQRFSRNPIINWYGSDIDGVIAYFRYVVVLKSDIGAADPIDWAMDNDNVDSSTGWTYKVVDPTDADPQTSQIVRMSADMSDPIRQFVEQYVFLQAVDAEGMPSDVVYRLFSRNDHPPQTLIFGYGSSDTPFVNSVFPAGDISGVHLRWIGSDPIDYPQDPPPFDFHWRLYGPYDSLEFKYIQDNFFTKVFLTREAEVIRLGTLLEKWDTTFIGPDSFTVKHDTVTVNESNVGRIATIFGADYGVFEKYFDIEATNFDTSSIYNNIVDESSGDGVWTSTIQDTLFNVFKDRQTDSTQQLTFIPWARSRDDAGVPDPVPAFLSNGIPVVDPKFERHVLILDYTNQASPGPLASVVPTQARAFWLEYINKWEVAAGLGSQFSISSDYLRVSSTSPPRGLLKRLMQHRTVILYNDHAIKSGFWEAVEVYGPVLKAISGGVNCWSQMRCPINGSLSSPAVTNPLPPLSLPYTLFFGVISPVPGAHMYYSGWALNADAGGVIGNQKRNESFKGARPLGGMESQWPALLIDTGLLHQNYIWTYNPLNRPISPYRWIDSLACLPEVNWTPRLSPGTEPMYFFYSMYRNDTLVLGDASNGRIVRGSHPLGEKFDHDFYPIAHSFDNGFFRTVHMDFTLPAIRRDGNLDIAFNRIMDYLWDGGPNPGLSVGEKRHPEAKAAWTNEQLNAAWKIVKDQWDRESGWKLEEASGE